MFRPYLGAAALALFTLPMRAQTQGVFPYRYHIDDLENGLRLVTIPTPFPEIVAVYIAVSVGSRNEVEPGKSGFAHFFEHMMFRGTKSRSASEQAAIFKQIGAARNAFTEDDCTVYHTTFGKEDLETVLELEADRFMNLEYSQKDFRTEAMAVFGEYNKNSSNPIRKLQEVLRDTAFTTHTYKHTTMGFLPDIVAMPKQYEYSKTFFTRWYKPENTTLLVVGEVERDRVLSLVKKHWSPWQKGFQPIVIPSEPAQTAPKVVHVPWPTPTQPWVTVAFRGPAVDDTQKDMPTLDVIGRLWFGQSSELYQRLYVKEQKVEALGASFPDHVDPHLVQIMARVRKPEDVAYVRDQILATCERAKHEAVDQERLQDVKRNLRYGFVASLSSSDAIANALIGYLARARTPATVDKIYALYDQVTTADVKEYSAKYFRTESRTIATLSEKPLPGFEKAENAQASRDIPVLAQPSDSPLVTLRLILKTGAAYDPKGKDGIANLLARFLVSSSTSKRSYEQIVKELYPMAATVSAQVDKEMTVFSGTVHKDNLEPFYGVFKEMLLEPGWQQVDLDRVKADVVAFLDDQLRRSNDEELGKEILQAVCHAGHPYEHHNAGTLEAIKALTLDDLKSLHQQWKGALFSSAGVLGLAGGYPEGFAQRVRDDLAQVPAPESGPGNLRIQPADWGARAQMPRPTEPTANTLTIVQKPTRATGIHIGFPIEVTRAHPDFAALWLVRSWLGEHRSENSFLYQRLREIRGLNYGDYAYIEYFPRGMFQFTPDPNHARRSQIFEIWIRPVPQENGPFALRAAWYELDKLCRNGLSQQDFAATRAFLSKSVNLLVDTQEARLGHALDSHFYGTPEFVPWIKGELAALTLEKVNAAIGKHLRSNRLHFVVVTQDAARFRDVWLKQEPAEITYQSKPADAVLEEDRIIGALAIPLALEHVRILPIEQVFAR